MVDGSVYEVVRTAADTGGDFVEMVFHLPPGCVPPPPHVHSRLVEEYEVLEGSFEVMVDGDWRTLGPGESASVPVGANHTFRMLPGQSVRVRNFHRPGGRFDEFVEKQHRFVSSGRYKGLKRPSTAIVMAMAWREHRDLLVPGNPLLRGGMAVVARLGRLLGYRT
jgi:mannose-6-phosphate isomerase-like protein (cupin superfamily)